MCCPTPPHVLPRPAGLRWSQQFPGNEWYYCRNIQDQAEQAAVQYDPTETYISFTCVVGLQDIYIIYTILWAAFFVIAVYLDNVCKNENGVRRWVCMCVWGGAGGQRTNMVIEKRLYARWKCSHFPRI